MAYMKFKELTKYFDFKTEVLDSSLLPEYTIEYLTQTENTLLAYKNSKDYILFTNKKMVLFDRDPLAAYYKKIHIVPYKSISTGAINYMPGKVELLFSLDSGYQLHINFIGMNHDKKENLKKVFNQILSNNI
ncbi:MAG: PH domain-containing protein [Bacilli bacterium]|nr:PH domain-containing protein [Bacilli bacterium]